MSLLIQFSTCRYAMPRSAGFLLIRQPETPEPGIRVDIMDPMLLNLGTSADWLGRETAANHMSPQP